MDAGVPIKAPVAGIAMGLMLEGDTGLRGAHRHPRRRTLGDMDFKVTGTSRGHHRAADGHQVPGHHERVIREGLEQALAARLFILDKMTAVLPAARDEMSDFAPRIITIKINPEKIREIIGKGG